MRLALSIIGLCLAGEAPALELGFPGAIVTATQSVPATSVRIPDAPWTPDASPFVVEGAVRKTAMRFAGASRTSLQLLQPVRDALGKADYSEVFLCQDAGCGGFDFRFQLDVIGEPEMHVDLGDFVYVLARRAENGDGPRWVSGVASRARDAGYVHVTEVFDTQVPPPEAPPDSVAPEIPASTPSGIGDTLLREGRVVLSDLDFGSGSAELALGPYDSLRAIGEILQADPAIRIVLVGHTDAVGSLEANTALSQKRAEAVAQALSRDFALGDGQVSAAGAGYLAPVASNLTEEGRAANRRVEAVLLSTAP